MFYDVRLCFIFDFILNYIIMKKLAVLFITVLILASCKKEHSKEYVTISGKIENSTDSIITILGTKGFLKRIKMSADGSFKDTLKVSEADIYTFQTSNKKRVPIYLNNGFDISLEGDIEELLTAFKISGKGAVNSELILAQINLSKKIGNPSTIIALEEDAFKKKMRLLKHNYDSVLFSYKDLDSNLLAISNKQNKQMLAYFENAYAKNRGMETGEISPKFEDYIDVKGGAKSLDFFKGKYVYIDVWATWCGPCIREIPSLQKLEKEFHNNNIEFVSISTDGARRSGGSWEAAEKKWRDFVKARQMTGVQLWSGKDFSFQQAYQINGIPRFILIDPNGKIVSANAPRPSDPNLKELFKSLDTF
jgi:thiol-disulfide isomerase/thioredoxin